jgi:ornithine cyclodeaminase/alanine dehydrogenase-like protein (mu-crystallin family)
MRYFAAAEIDRALTFPKLIEALANAFRGGFIVPQRHHHAITYPDGSHATHLLMPAWRSAGDFLGVKIVNVFPENGKVGLPAVQGTYVLQSGKTGETLALFDGVRLTTWRTAAASALAASYLARAEASKLLIVGSGALAPFLAHAHASVRPIESIEVWNHRPEGAQRLAATLAAEGFDVSVADNLQEAVRKADIVSCATLSHSALISGAWLQPGQHLDLVGAFNMQMREADDVALKRARIFVDTPAALNEGGDVAQALAAGVLTKADIVGDLAALVSGAPARTTPEEITLFKSVGASLEDLAAAILVYTDAP